MNLKEQPLGLMFCGVCVVALLQMLFYNLVVWPPTGSSVSRMLITWWLVTGLGFLGFFGVGRTLTIDFPGNLQSVLFAIFGGVFIGCAAGMGIYRVCCGYSLLLTTRRSPFILQISFMAFTAVYLAHFRLQGRPLFHFIRGGIKRRESDPSITDPFLILPLFSGVIFLGIIKDVLYWAVILWVKGVPGLIIFWLGVGGMLFGGYWMIHKLKLDLNTNLPRVLLALLGGAYGGSTVIPLLIKIGPWILGSPWFLQSFFMGFTVVSVVHLKSQ